LDGFNALNDFNDFNGFNDLSIFTLGLKDLSGKLAPY